jgi:hypothetical protein
MAKVNCRRNMDFKFPVDPGSICSKVAATLAKLVDLFVELITGIFSSLDILVLPPWPSSGFRIFVRCKC